MTDSRVHLTESVPELSTCRITGQLVDENDVGVPAAQLNTFTMTLWAITPDGTRPIVNGNSNIDVLNANQGTVDGSGNFVITLSELDNIIMASGFEHEIHRMLLTWTYAIATETGRFQIDFDIFHVDKDPGSS
jgi:hypothetical protein